MPVITMESAKLNKVQKQTLVKEFTQTAARVTGIAQEAFYVFIRIMWGLAVGFSVK